MSKVTVFSIHIAVFFGEGVKVPVLKLANMIQDRFAAYFQNQEPHILPMPEDAPADAARCLFINNRVNPKVDSLLTFSYERLDFEYLSENCNDWKNQLETCAMSLFAICKEYSIPVTRVGFVVSADCEDDLKYTLDSRIGIDDFASSDEKKISYLVKKNSGELPYNLITIINVNDNEEVHKNVLKVDVNTEKKLIWNYRQLVNWKLSVL